MPSTKSKIFAAVKQYPYRSATIRERFLSIPRHTVKELEEQLAEAAGVQIDNHVVYEIVQGGHVVHIMFTDESAVFGHSVEERSW